MTWARLTKSCGVGSGPTTLQGQAGVAGVAIVMNNRTAGLSILILWYA